MCSVRDNHTILIYGVHKQFDKVKLFKYNNNTNIVNNDDSILAADVDAMSYLAMRSFKKVIESWKYYYFEILLTTLKRVGGVE